MGKSIFLRPADAAALLVISRTKMYELIARGEIPSCRIGGVLRVPREAVERLASEALAEREGGSR